MEKCEGQTDTIEINVKPNGPTGQPGEVDCDISGTNVIDHAIILPKNGTFEIRFNLDGPATASWHDTNPFCAQVGKCPRLNSASHGNMTVTSNSSRQFTVQARAMGRRTIFHYRLNFAGGGTCDPIIIRDNQ